METDSLIESIVFMQALTGNDQERRLQFCNFMQMETDGFVESIVFVQSLTGNDQEQATIF